MKRVPGVLCEVRLQSADISSITLFEQLFHTLRFVFLEPSYSLMVNIDLVNKVCKTDESILLDPYFTSTNVQTLFIIST